MWSNEAVKSLCTSDFCPIERASNEFFRLLHFVTLKARQSYGVIKNFFAQIAAGGSDNWWSKVGNKFYPSLEFGHNFMCETLNN